jgi:SPP1 gp7 family putative phage head morphogenesis protein
LGLSLALIDQVAVTKAIKNPSLKVSTIERNEKNLKILRDELTQNIIQGKSYKTTAKVVSERFTVALSKSDRIVRTENHRVQIDARIDGFKSAEDMGINIMKEWVSAIDERTRASHRGLNGTIIPIDDKFRSSSGGYGLAPGQMGTASDDINCRCSLAAVVL